MLLYVTADTIGAATGGGIVTAKESEALKELGDCLIINRDYVEAGTGAEPWRYDDYLVGRYILTDKSPKLAHFYAGTFGKSVKKLKEVGCKVCYTIAAHDRAVSKREHEKLGLPFPYTHLTNEAEWQRYIEGYRQADVIVCPGSVPAQTVRNYGPEFAAKQIVIIPHGCDLPAKYSPLPTTFTVGYLGGIAGAADKGVAYLVQAWKKLNYKDGSLLILAGRDPTHPWTINMVRALGGGNIHLAGWQKNVSNFYNKLSLYIQPSCTEGFGIEVCEAASYGRPVLCSKGAGACDLLPEVFRFAPMNADLLAACIDDMKHNPNLVEIGKENRKVAERYTWVDIKEQYKELWKSLLRR